MTAFIENLFWAISSIPRQAVIAFLVIVLIALFVMLILCLCRAAKMGDDLQAENDAQAEWLMAKRHKRNQP